MKSKKIIEVLDGIPMLPGIYQMIDRRGRIIYIGKSVSLRHRVKSYFTGVQPSEKIETMVRFIDDIRYVVCDTHLEARLLECRLTKKHKPIYNTQYARDRKATYLEVGTNPNKKPLIHTQNPTAIGPFGSASGALQIVDRFSSLYPIKDLNGKYEFDYQVLPIKLDSSTFEENRRHLEKILTNGDALERFMVALRDKMLLASAELKFERAGYFKRFLKTLQYYRKAIIDFQELSHQKIFLHIPLDIGGKSFLLYRGIVWHAVRFYSLSDREKTDFLRDGLQSVRDEGESDLDLLRILYSELLSLPQAWWEVIP